MAATNTLTPTVRVNEFGVYAFSPLLADTVTGHDLAVRDWYGEVHLTCTGVDIGLSGYPSALKFTRADGREGRFSLHTAREIEILG